jgi:hypothetical protein
MESFNSYRWVTPSGSGNTVSLEAIGTCINNLFRKIILI